MRFDLSSHKGRRHARAVAQVADARDAGELAGAASGGVRRDWEARKGGLLYAGLRAKMLAHPALAAELSKAKGPLAPPTECAEGEGTLLRDALERLREELRIMGGERPALSDKEYTALKDTTGALPGGTYELQTYDPTLPADWEDNQHPMRAMPLVNVLRTSLWTTVPNFFGAQPAPAADEYNLSASAERCSYFVSHAWKEPEKNNAKKVSMMRLFLCVQPLVAHLLVSFLLIAAFLLPLGLAVGAEVNPRDADGHAALWSGPLPAHLFSLLALGMLFSLLLWIGLAQYSIVPSRLSPWALSSTTLWLDKCCIDQAVGKPKIEKGKIIGAGTSSFKRYLGQCDGMIAFVSAAYFSRLWCATRPPRVVRPCQAAAPPLASRGSAPPPATPLSAPASHCLAIHALPRTPNTRCVYELATFSKIQGDAVHQKLLLFSLEWPNFSLRHSSALSECEREWFTSFSCLKVDCFKPEDRATVMAEIRESWGSEEAFDSYVQSELPRIMEESKRRYARQLLTVALRTLENTFGG